ncbi:hypothetical protein BFF78_28865 [Streptomyces fodineus]|uniref:Transcriptional regulator n=1 Tax=Streptomyces fodineus TaxID=1904616 RepID=A0A1D7YG72_9ACTN|nr:hypothetical protein [Streptomyces fodineus]AOR34526.1 hypothetical protein BFF78_28865 [Streptomyces fodineus]
MNEKSLLATCLMRLAWSPEQLANEINKKYGTGTISSKAPYNWLKGARPRRRLPYVVAQILSDRLREPITVEALWPQHFTAAQDPAAQAAGFRSSGTSGAAEPGPDLIAAAVDWLVAGEADAPSRLRGDELPAVAVDLLTTRIRQLRELDDACRGTRLVLDWAFQDFQWARRLATECCYDAETGVRLHRGIAELGQLAGWLAADLGMTRRSRSCFVTALHATHTAGDRALAAYIISCMSYHATWEGRGEEALRLIRIARKGSAVEDMGLGAALLATREARAHASLGDETGCRLAMDAAAELSRHGEPPADAPWAYWLTPAVMVADAGRAWLELGRPHQAEQHLAHGIELLGESQPLNRLLHHTSLAEARLSRHVVDGAAEAAHDALSLAGRATSGRARARLTALRHRFQRYDNRAARDFVQRADDLLSADPQEPAS